VAIYISKSEEASLEKNGSGHLAIWLYVKLATWSEVRWPSREKRNADDQDGVFAKPVAQRGVTGKVCGQLSTKKLYSIKDV
jgi:hypothetical protein